MNLRIDLWIWGSTYELEDRPMNLRIDLWIWGSSYEFEDRPMNLRIDLWIWGSTYEFEDRPMNLTEKKWNWKENLHRAKIYMEPIIRNPQTMRNSMWKFDFLWTVPLNYAVIGIETSNDIGSRGKPGGGAGGAVSKLSPRGGGDSF